MSLKPTSSKSQTESRRPAQSRQSQAPQRTKSQAQTARQGENARQNRAGSKTGQDGKVGRADKTAQVGQVKNQERVSLSAEAAPRQDLANTDKTRETPDFNSWASENRAAAVEAAAAAEQDPLKAAVMRTEGLTEVAQQDVHLGHAFQSMLSGNKEGLWAMPYLENIARQGWAQEYGQGQSAENAPQDYINSWIDAWSGGDTNIPGAKALNESMDRLGLGTPETIQAPPAPGQVGQTKGGAWNDPYTLAPRQKYSNDCGVTAARSALRSQGFDADQDTLFADARSKGYHNGEAWNGPAKMRDYLQSFGMDSQLKGFSRDNINEQLANGNPVILSTAAHYFTISGQDEKGNYILGETGNVVGLGATASYDQLARYSNGHTLITTGPMQGQPRQPAEALEGTSAPPAPAAPGRAVNPRNLALGIDERPQPGSLGSAGVPSGSTEGIPDYGTHATKSQVNEQLEAAAEKYGIPTDLLKAVAWQESKFDARALSFDAQHGKGVMQIDDRFHEFARTGDYFNSAENIDYGARFLSDLHHRYGNWDTALLRYNGGSDYPPLVRRWERERPWEAQV